MPRTPRSKFSKKQRRSGGKKKRSNKTRKGRQPKVVYIYQPANAQPQPHPPQQPLPPPQQPQPGVFTWGDAGKLLAVDVGAIMLEKGLDEAME